MVAAGVSLDSEDPHPLIETANGSATAISVLWIALQRDMDSVLPARGWGLVRPEAERALSSPKLNGVRIWVRNPTHSTNMHKAIVTG